MNTLITDLAAAAEPAPLVERFREILDPLPPLKLGTERAVAGATETMTDESGPHKKLTVLKQASQELPKETHESRRRTGVKTGTSRDEVRQ